MSKLFIGWSEVDITPDKKISLAGQFAERISQYVEKPLTVTAAEAAELARSKAGDWYLVDKEFSWTFAHTHEEQCGPYFCKR